MFNKIKDLKEAWEEGIINLYPAADKGTPGIFAANGNTHSNIGFGYSTKDENTKKWLETRPENKQFFSHAFFWDKSPFDSFEELIEISNREDDDGKSEITGWCVLIGRGSNKDFLKEDDGELRLACIDIDGYKPQNDPNNEIRKRSCDEIYKSISENADFDFFAEKSQGGGYHIWYLTKERVRTKQVSNLQLIKYPKTSEFKNYVLNKETEFIEIFADGGHKYVSCSPTNKYTFMDTKSVEILKMKPVENINEAIKKALVAGGFIYDISLKKEEPKTDTSTYNTSNLEYDVLIENIMKCYRQGTMNEFGYKLIANLRRAEWDKDKIYSLFKKLPIEQDLKKVRADINQQFSTDMGKISKISGLLEAVEDYCEPKNLIEKTQKFFKEFFQENIEFDIPKFEKYQTDEMILHENKLFILYDAYYWISQAAGEKIEDECEKSLNSLAENNVFYLVVEQDKMGYHFSWSTNLIAPSRPPNVFNNFLDEADSKRNQYIGSSSIYFQISRCKRSISLFLNDIREKINNLKDEGISIQNLLNHNAEIYDYMEYLNECNGINSNTLNEIHYMNNQYIINDVNIGKMKIIEKKNIMESRYNTEGKQVKPEIYGESEKEIIGHFGISKISNLTDILKNKTPEEIEVIIRGEHYNYIFEDTDELIKKISQNSGTIIGRNDSVKKSMGLVINYIKNSGFYQNKKYCSKDGIFYDNEDKKFKYVVNQEFINIGLDKIAIKKSLVKLKSFFEISSIKDKSKIAEIFRWILFSPYSYSYKEFMNNNIFFPYLILQGEKKTGKSAIMAFFRRLYRDGDELEASSHGRSKHQFASLLGEKGWFTSLEESKGILEDVEKVEDLKNYVSINTIRRKQTEKADYDKIVAYSYPIFSLNDNLSISSDSLLRRVIQLFFNSEDIPNDDEKKLFKMYNDSEWLLPIGDAFFLFCNENIELFKEGWKPIVSNFIEELEDKYEIDLSELKLKYEKEDIFNNPDELLKETIINIIKEDFAKINHTDLNADLKDTSAKPKYKKESSTIERFRNAVISSRFPYLVQNKKGKNIGITKEIINLVKRKNPNFDVITIAKITELFNGKNKIQVQGNSIRSCVLTSDELQKYLAF